MSDQPKVLSPIWVCILAGIGAQYILAIPLSLWVFGVDGLSFNLALLFAQIVLTAGMWFVIAHWFDCRDRQIKGES